MYKNLLNNITTEKQQITNYCSINKFWSGVRISTTSCICDVVDDVANFCTEKVVWSSKSIEGIELWSCLYQTSADEKEKGLKKKIINFTILLTLLLQVDYVRVIILFLQNVFKKLTNNLVWLLLASEKTN